MKGLLIAALFVTAPVHTYAQAESGTSFDCRDYYGLNICADGLGSPPDLPYDLADHLAHGMTQGPVGDPFARVELDRNSFTTTPQQQNQVFTTTLPTDEVNPSEREDIFASADAFRAYMQTVTSTDRVESDSEFLLTTRILENGDFGLDCRLVTQSISKLSSSNYVDCALQKHF